MRKLLALCLLGIGLLMPNKVSAAGFNSTATGGLWSDASTWAEGSVPVKGSTVTITQGSTVTVRAPFDIGTGVASNIAMGIYGYLYFPYDIDSGTWNIRGSVHVYDQASGSPSRWDIASETTPLLSTNTINIIMECGTTTRNILFEGHQGAIAGSVRWYGSITSTNTLTCPYKTTTTTRVTTSSNSVILSEDIDAKIGQEWALSPTENITETDDALYVIGYDMTVPSITFNRNFTYAHNKDTVLYNVSRNIVLKSTTVASYNTLYIYKEVGLYTRESNCDFRLQNVRIENIGSNGYSINMNGWVGTFTGCVWYKSGYVYLNSASEQQFTDCIWHTPRYSGAIACNTSDTSGGIIFTRCIFNQNTTGSALNMSGLSSSQFYDSIIIGSQYAMAVGATNNCLFKNTKAYCIRGVYGQLSSNSFTDNIIDSFTFVNTALVPTGNNSPSLSIFYTPQSNFKDTFINFKSHYFDTPIWGGTSSGLYRSTLFQDGEGRFQNYNQTIGRHMVVTIYGIVYVDSTTVRTNGNSGLRFEDVGSTLISSGYKYTKINFKVNCNMDDTILFRGYVKTNTNYIFAASSSPYVKVYTDNLGVVSYSTATTASQASWELLTAGGTATSTGTVTVELAARLSAGCTAYWDDMRLYVGNNVYALGKDWVDGYPQASPVASTVDAENIWNANVLSYPTANTTGKYLFEIRKRVP